jgi:hypothetical protein
VITSYGSGISWNMYRENFQASFMPTATLPVLVARATAKSPWTTLWD